MEAQIKLLQEQQKLLETEAQMKCSISEGKDEEKCVTTGKNNTEKEINEVNKIEKECIEEKNENKVKETNFVNPTVDQIKQLQEEPKNLEMKKTD